MTTNSDSIDNMNYLTEIDALHLYREFPRRARVALTVLRSSVGAARKVSTNWSQETVIFILPI